MPQFRKKPVVIEAVQFKEMDGDDPVFATQPPEWLVTAMRSEKMWVEDGRLCVDTLEGGLTVSPGDWIIRGVEAEIYPCKPTVFAATYEAA